MSMNPAIGVNAGGVIVGRMLDYVAKQAPSEQEKRGDKRLEDARSLIVEHQQVIHSSDREVVEEKII